MRLITMVNKWGNITVKEEKIDGARREWVVRDQLEIYLVGSFDKIEYDAACNLACNIAQEMHIPLTQLVKVASFSTRSNKRDTQSRRMF